MAAFQLDLPAYLKRVGLDAAAVASPTAETLAALMLAQSRAHAAATLALLPLITAASLTRAGAPRPPAAVPTDALMRWAGEIPFENLDVVLGKQISIEPAVIESTLVLSGRGGYCFQMNGLLGMALEAVGFAVAPLLCKVRWNKAPDEETTFTHTALRVTLPGGERYLADVGFAGTNSLAPISMDTAEAQATFDGTFRVTVGDDGWSVASSELKGVWRDLYKFRDEVTSDIDLQLSNWWSCTHPSARFTNQFFVARVVGDDKHHILDDTYTVRKADGTSETTEILSKQQLLELLDTVFGLVLPAEAEVEAEAGGIDRYLTAAAAL